MRLLHIVIFVCPKLNLLQHYAEMKVSTFIKDE